MVFEGSVPNLARLAQYRPWERGGLDLQAVLTDLVLAVAGINGGPIGTLLECRQSFADLWNLEVEVDELRPVLEQMATEGTATKSGRSFTLTDSAMTDLEAKAAESEDLEGRAFREWELGVRQRAPELSAQDITDLRTDLEAWLREIIARHGAEAALMLYPEEDRAKRFLDTLNADGFSGLPDRGSGVERVRSDALLAFVRNPSPDQRRYLASLLNTSFYMTVLTIDPAADQLVKAQLAGHRIYLDTNFLYAVLGAASTEEVYSSRRLIQLSKELGFTFAVTPWTMKELRTSIARSRRGIENQAQFIRPELADAMLGTTGDKGFQRLFWQTYRDKRTQPKDVFDRLEHFDKDLRDYGIDEISEACIAIDQQHERVGLYASLLNAERWPYQRDPPVLEHDAKCRLLVERLRGDGKINISNARFWFLTYDTKLPRFALKVPDNGDEPPELPFCVSPSAWVQIIRALTPRTDDFERTVVDLLTSPFVGYRPGLSAAVVEQIVGRMDHMEDASPEMAIAVLTDSAKVTEIERAVASEDQAVVEEAVATVYSDKAKEMEAAVAVSQKRLAEIEREMEQSRKRAVTQEQNKDADVASVRAEHARDREAWEAEKRGLEAHLLDTQAARDDEAIRAERTEDRIQQVEGTLEEKDLARSRNRRVGLGVLLILLGVAVGIVGALLIFSTPWGIGGTVIAGAALVLVGLRVALGKDWGGEVVLWGGLLTAIAAIVVAILLGSHD